jgi:hypothetical protein
MSGDDTMADRPEAADDASSAAVGRANLAAQLRQLEDFAARTVSEGDSVPPQATEMIAHLREIVQALDGLTASMTERSTPHQTEPADSRDRPGRMEDDRP